MIWRNMNPRRIEILLVTVVLTCLVGLSLLVIDPVKHGDSGSLLLEPGDFYDLSSGVCVAEYELHRGEVVDYSFDASGTVRYTILAHPIVDGHEYFVPRMLLLTVTDSSASDTFMVAFHGIYRFVFTNPNGPSDVELTYALGHILPGPTFIGLCLMTLAVVVGSLMVEHLILSRVSYGEDYSPEQLRINNIRERRRSDCKCVWLRH